MTANSRIAAGKAIAEIATSLSLSGTHGSKRPAYGPENNAFQQSTLLSASVIPVCTGWAGALPMQISIQNAYSDQKTIFMAILTILFISLLLSFVSQGAGRHAKWHMQILHIPLVQILHTWLSASDQYKFCNSHFSPPPTGKDSLPVAKYHSPFLRAPRRLRELFSRRDAEAQSVGSR